MQTRTYLLHDEAGTLALGASLARTLVPGLVMYLQGDLGAGKTTLVRALLHAAGYPGHVKSPTYTLVESYLLDFAGHWIELFHFDLYRMRCAEEFDEAGFREHFGGNRICLVEWPENGAPLLPPADIALHLSVSGEGRKVELQAISDKGSACLERLDFVPNL
ncbi:MAG: tRNA (adenosine(37)-N6)-threonylcarbamoyltransferase complex ATPase subunit type 1 TsaE [Burkholderiaceae bacterium]|nr:tRNA (adenosine(37)-N6)-threonylcarbamoyltransferase complex ATPase subunit type 1 TsaE [Burkholderiaceae bacterium]